MFAKNATCPALTAALHEVLANDKSTECSRLSLTVPLTAGHRELEVGAPETRSMSC
jgi:hypothetical protein